MAIVLTAPRAIPNCTRIVVRRFDPDNGNGKAVAWVVARAGGLDGPESAVVLDDAAPMLPITANPSPTGLSDVISRAPAEVIANASTGARNAYATAGGHAAGLRAVETDGLAKGWIKNTFAGAVT